MRYPKVFTSVMAGALALSLGLTACSGGGDTKSSEDSAEKTEQVEEKDTKTEEKDSKTEEKDSKDAKSGDTEDEKDSKSSKSSKDDEEEDSKSSKSSKDDEEEDSKSSKSSKDDEEETEDTENALDEYTKGWKTGYMGLSEAGEYYYYAESPNGSEGILVIMNDEGEYVSYVGDVTNDEDDSSIITIEDSSTGNTFSFQIVEVDEDDNLVLDLGDLGKVIFAKAPVSDVIDAVKTIDENGTAVA